MRVRIEPSQAYGTVVAPSSKSFAHRMLICAALADGTSVIHGVGDSEDICATLDCIAALGAEYKRDGSAVTVRGVHLHEADGCPRDKTFSCRESGSTLRFFIPPAVALSHGEPLHFTGAKRLLERGVAVYEDVLGGVEFAKSDSAIDVSGTLSAGEFEVAGNVSSQYISGLLLALPLLQKSSVVRILQPFESRAYVDVTVDVMKRFGVNIRCMSEDTFEIDGGQRYIPADVTVEGDWSNAAALLAFNAAGGNVTVAGLNENSLQGDRICVDCFDKLMAAEPVIDISNCPDLGPVLFAAAALGHGAKFTGTARLKIKESDRAAVMVRELAKFGVVCDVDDNSVTVRCGKINVSDEPLDCCNDHRIVMALSILASKTGAVIDGAQAINKSYPNYFIDIKKLGIKVNYDA